VREAILEKVAIDLLLSHRLSLEIRTKLIKTAFADIDEDE
jgi:hypothetical protein